MKIITVFEYANKDELQDAIDRAHKLTDSELLYYVHAIEFSDLKGFILEIRRYSNHIIIIDRTIERTAGRGKVIVAEDEGKLDRLYAVDSAIERALRQRFKKVFMLKWDESGGGMKLCKNEFVIFSTTYRDVVGKQKYTMIRVAGENIPVKYVKNKDDMKAMIHASFYAEVVEKCLDRVCEESNNDRHGLFKNLFFRLTHKFV